MLFYFYILWNQFNANNIHKTTAVNVQETYELCIHCSNSTSWINSKRMQNKVYRNNKRTLFSLEIHNNEGFTL